MKEVIKISIFERIMGKNEAIEFSYDLDLLRDTSHKAYIKKWALNTCINHIARTISQTKFEVIDKGVKDETSVTYYKLNVRPNTDESASTFWQRAIRKLIFDNEVLIVVTDTKDLIIADDFEREEYALYDDIFKHVKVKDFEFERNFKMSEVIYITYSNESISSLLDGLFTDYGNIFARIVKYNLMSNQIRATLSFDGNVNAQTQQNMQNFINKSYEAFEQNDIAIVPVQKGYEYKEHTTQSQSKSTSQIEDLTKVPNQLLKYVASSLGIPFPLIDGSVADIEAMTDNYMKFCIMPILENIVDELNAKCFSEKDYREGKRIKAISIDAYDPIQKAEAIDKLIASSVFTANQVLDMFGYPPSDDEDADKRVITKNLQSVKEVSESSLKGGENNEDRPQ
ncbi:phage portal protein [Mammaliicoccus vitulinus]|uniref:Phage portal protein n=2 Tax=Mammaliicoccus vitulinus TaxID=71237 RepID=A0ABX7HG45_9STAP|nr:phage portal protein [Mammaliicoccus vitulinus]QRO85133.1 phage portal protein [Mammaliicoccus vitulinus]